MNIKSLGKWQAIEDEFLNSDFGINLFACFFGNTILEILMF